MITRHTQKSSWDKFEVQDIAIEKFRKFATEHNVSIKQPSYLNLWFVSTKLNGLLPFTQKCCRNGSLSFSRYQVHVTLVVHPRKEDESSALSISSFFGSAKATQEADTVIIIQNDANRRKYLDVKKNRFDGTLGYSPIYFQSKSGRYVEDEASAGKQPAQQQQQQQQYHNNSRPNGSAKPPEPKNLEDHHNYFQGPPPKRS